MKPVRSVAGPFLTLLLAIAAGWLMQPADTAPQRIPTRLTPAPDWSLDATSGTTNKLSDYRGKVIILNFWATYCPPCLREIPDLSAFYRALPAHGMEVIGILVEPESRLIAPDFVRRNRIPYPVLYGTREVAEAYGVLALPQTFIIDPAGRIAGRYLGRMRQSDLENAIAPFVSPHLTNKPTGTLSGTW